MNIRIKDARYAGTVYEDLPPRPEIAFAGRSNVGKSTLINALLNRRGLVKTSKQPGKTRNVNYFSVETSELAPLYMVDLPGYGFAKVSDDMKETWRSLTTRYFSANTNIRMLLLLVDMRRDIRQEEKMILDLGRQSNARTLVVATKADKLIYSERKRRLNDITRQCGCVPVGVSSLKNMGIEDLWTEIADAVGELPGEG